MTPALSSRFRVFATFAAAFAVLTTGLVVVAPAAQAVDTASISGTILGSAAAPLEGASINVYKLGDGPLEFVGSAVSGPTGAYTVSALPAGESFTVLFTADGYASQYFDAAPSLDSATFLPLAEGQARTGVDATLGLAGSVAGTITNEGGDPEGSIYVEAMMLLPGGTYTPAGPPAYTESNGSYLVEGLPAGTYTLRLQGGTPGYPAQYLGGSTTIAGSTQFTLGAGETKLGVDGVVRLTPAAGATVQGTVIGNASAPLLNAIVTPYRFDGVWQEGTSTVTAIDGTYSFTNLEPGSYRFKFERTGYVTEYWDAAATLATATSVALTNQTESAINASMVEASMTATVSGTVLLGGGASALDVQVDVVDRTSSDVVESRDVEPDGSYSIDGLLPGTYTLKFHRDGTVPLVPTQYLGGVVGLAAAQNFVLVAGQQKTLNVTLKLTSATTTTLSTGSRAYGVASTATVRVTAAAGTPTGAVTLKEGTRTVGSGALVAGKATLTLPKTLAVGKHNLVAVYAGSSGFFSSTATARALTVVKAKPTMSAKLAKKSIKAAARGKLTVVLKATGVVPGGSVRIKDGKKVLKTVKLSDGKVTVRLPKLKQGKHKLTVTYLGSSTVARATRTVTLTVTA